MKRTYKFILCTTYICYIKNLYYITSWS